MVWMYIFRTEYHLRQYIVRIEAALSLVWVWFKERKETIIQNNLNRVWTSTGPQNGLESTSKCTKQASIFTRWRNGSTEWILRARFAIFDPAATSKSTLYSLDEIIWKHIDSREFTQNDLDGFFLTFWSFWDDPVNSLKIHPINILCEI